MVLTPAALAELVNLALTGNRGAQTRLYEFLKPTIHHAVARVVKLSGTGRERRDEMLDLIQDVAIHLILTRTLESWDRSRPLENYAYRIAYNKALDLLQHRFMNPWATPVDSVRMEILLPCVVGTQDETAISRNVLELLYSGLNPEEQKLFQMMFIHERTLEEACVLLGLPADAKGADALRKKVGRLRRKCRELLADASGEGAEGRNERDDGDEEERPTSEAGTNSDDREDP